MGMITNVNNGLATPEANSAAKIFSGSLFIMVNVSQSVHLAAGNIRVQLMLIGEKRDDNIAAFVRTIT
jgi:hypothetical protein